MLLMSSFLTLPDGKPRTQNCFKSYIFLTGLNPVNMPTYPAKLVALKTVLLFLWKSRFTVKGFNSSVTTQVLLFIFHLKKTSVADVKDKAEGESLALHRCALCACH